ncbi:MAG: nucleotidyltransferase domain-containing protein [Thermodesulfovibrionales bacterium]|nr:nucleotidyltransferase domain-containing protein [Thermodesulfovibrionales bacterium]
MPFDTSLWEKIIERKYTEREKIRIETLDTLIMKLRDYFTHKKVKGVYIIGSVLKEGAFYDFSDIDIAVDGFSDDYFRVSAELEDLVSREIELIELEKCKFKESIEKYGLRVL